MAVANAVRPDRPSTRSTRSTRSTGEINKASTRETTGNRNHNRKIESLNDRRNRPSTRGTDGSSIQKPRRPASTRNQTTGDPAVRPTTRKRASTRTMNAPDAGPSRSKVFEARREANRLMAPVQFILVMFLVVIVSVFAFGLLRGGPTAQMPERPKGGEDVEIIYEKEGTTSTNTGILRGH